MSHDEGENYCHNSWRLKSVVGEEGLTAGVKKV